MNFKLDVMAENGVPFRVVFLPFGENMSGAPLVKFYDRRYAHTPDGQFTGGRCDLSTILAGDSFSGLNLYGGVPDWTVDGDTMHLVRKWLNSFEILPAS